MTVKILNTSSRKFQIEGGEFGPNEVVSLSKDQAETLLSMYPGELVDLASHAKDLSDTAKTLAAQEPAKPVEVKLDKEVTK